jgi:hypothetical protein
LIFSFSLIMLQENTTAHRLPLALPLLTFRAS